LLSVSRALLLVSPSPDFTAVVERWKESVLWTLMMVVVVVVIMNVRFDVMAEVTAKKKASRI
jgi:hypothetical protein